VNFPESRLPLGRTLVGAALALAERRRGLAHAAALPLAAHGGLDVWSALAPEAARAALPGAMLLGLALHVLLSVHVTRLVLEGEASVPAFGLTGWGRRQWRYLGGLGIQTLAVTAAAITLSPVALLGVPGLVVTGLGCAWVAGRAALVLPPIALGRSWDPREVFQRGRAAGFSLAVIAVIAPLAPTLLLQPLLGSGLLPFTLLGSVLAVGVSAWSVAALALAWLQLGPRPGPVEVETPSGEPSLRLLPDADRGLLELRVAGRFGTRDFGHAAAGDALVGYHGRLRGLLLDLRDEAWGAGDGERAWDALDTLLSHLGLVRIHHEYLERVALVGAESWSPLLERLGKHFGRAELRWFPEGEGERARAWAAGEGPAAR
jgi:hypothetical protein